MWKLHTTLYENYQEGLDDKLYGISDIILWVEIMSWTSIYLYWNEKNNS